MAESAVELHGIGKRYAQHQAVRDLSLRVPSGSVYGLLGPNGAGKTTTIRMINDITRPDEGRITLFASLPPGREALRRIGYLPEERGLYPKMTVRRVLTFLAELRGVKPAVAGTRIARWLDRLELAAWVDRKVETLSKGMQQKVQFIATVLHEPDLLILDEPFSGLDPINADVLRGIIQEQRKAGRTIIFSTHLMEHAEQLCDELCIIAQSEKVLEGRLTDIRESARDRRNAYLIETTDRAGEGPPAALAVNAETGVVSVMGADGRYQVELSPATSPRALLRRLVEGGVDVTKLVRAEPTLHEIFVEAVQRKKNETGAAPSEEIGRVIGG